MNFLAHAYLSFDDPDILVGNFVADFVRGRQINNFSENVQRGIRLHRLIDQYTDSHDTIRNTKTMFDRTAGRYNATFLDIAFDHFLALDTVNEPPEGWKDFTEQCYALLQNRMNELPDDFKRFFSYMYKEDWLFNYRYKWMIEKSFDRMAHRAKFLSDDAGVFRDFNKNYKELQMGYDNFFPDLYKYVSEVYSKNDF